MTFRQVITGIYDTVATILVIAAIFAFIQQQGVYNILQVVAYILVALYCKLCSISWQMEK